MILTCICRQGVLPWTNFWVTTKPFGTPIGPYFVKWALTALMILALPSGDAFNFGEFEPLKMVPRLDAVQVLNVTQ